MTVGPHRLFGEMSNANTSRALGSMISVARRRGKLSLFPKAQLTQFVRLRFGQYGRPLPALGREQSWVAGQTFEVDGGLAMTRSQ